MSTSPTREPNSIRYWRLNEMQGIQACLRSPSQACDPEDLQRILGQRQRLADLSSHDRRVLARFHRVTASSRRLHPAP